MITLLKIVALIVSLELCVFGSVFHEFIHWIVLRRYGYRSHLVKTNNFNRKYLPSIGMKPEGLRENFICARELQQVLYAPLFPSVFIFIAAFSISSLRVDIYSVFAGLLVGVISSGADLYMIYKIRKWWISPDCS